jgi:nucleoside-diphosphate-sugar epimerase
VSPLTVAIIGASGFAGGFLARRLAAAGHQVRAVNRGDCLPDISLDLVIDCNGDARRFWANANPIDSFQANVAPLAERLTRLRYGTYIYLSTIDVYGPGRAACATSTEDRPIVADELDTYGFHKYLAEQMVAFHAVDHLILRLGTLVGPGLRKNPVHDALAGDPIRQTPHSTLSLLHLDCLGTAIEQLLPLGERGIFNVTGCEPISIATILARIARVRGMAVEDFVFHPETITTDYDISTDKISRLTPMPTSEAMLDLHLTQPQGPAQ